jgi:hypothetical protein
MFPPDLDELTDGLRTVVRDLEPETLLGGQAANAVDRFAELERLAAVGKLLAAARVGECNTWKHTGHKTLASWLAAKSGTGLAPAADGLAMVGRLDECRGTDKALRAGELSVAQAKEVTLGAAAAPEAEDDLLDLARRDDPAAPASPEVSPNSAPEPVGTTQQLSWMVERAESAIAAIPAVVDPTVALSGSGRWAAAKVIVRVDHSALERGYTEGDEVCEIAGVGPVPVSVVEEMIAGDAFLAAIVTKGHDVLNVAHLGRQANAYQRTGLEWNYQTCTVLGCSNPRMQTDHRLDYADTHHTKLDELDGLCTYHHALKTFEGWALVRGKGRRDMVPPNDPRHPDAAKAKKNAKRATNRAHRRSKQTARSG